MPQYFEVSIITNKKVERETLIDFSSANGWFNNVKHQYGDIITIEGTRVKIGDVYQKTMFLVPSEIHKIAHIGGGSMIKYGLKGAFQSPIF